MIIRLASFSSVRVQSVFNDTRNLRKKNAVPCRDVDVISGEYRVIAVRQYGLRHSVYLH